MDKSYRTITQILVRDRVEKGKRTHHVPYTIHNFCVHFVHPSTYSIYLITTYLSYLSHTSKTSRPQLVPPLSYYTFPSLSFSSTFMILVKGRGGDPPEFGLDWTHPFKDCVDILNGMYTISGIRNSTPISLDKPVQDTFMHRMFLPLTYTSWILFIKIRVMINKGINRERREKEIWYWIYLHDLSPVNLSRGFFKYPDELQCVDRCPSRPRFVYPRWGPGHEKGVVITLLTPPPTGSSLCFTLLYSLNRRVSL